MPRTLHSLLSDLYYAVSAKSTNLGGAPVGTPIARLESLLSAAGKENILSKTVDLTSANVGRQNLFYINFGEKGVRINDASRQQRCPQMRLPKLVIRILAARPVPAAVPPHALPIRSGELSPLRSVRVGPALAVEHPESLA